MHHGIHGLEFSGPPADTRMHLSLFSSGRRCYGFSNRVIAYLALFDNLNDFKNCRYCNCDNSDIFLHRKINLEYPGTFPTYWVDMPGASSPVEDSIFSLSLSREASVFFADFLQDFNDAFKDFNDLFHVGVFGFDFCGVELHLVMCLCEVRRNGGLGNISGK